MAHLFLRMFYVLARHILKLIQGPTRSMKNLFLLVLSVTSTLSQKCKRPKVFLQRYPQKSKKYPQFRVMLVTRSRTRGVHVISLSAQHSAEGLQHGSVSPTCRLTNDQVGQFYSMFNSEESAEFTKVICMK